MRHFDTFAKKKSDLPVCSEDTFAGLDFCPFSAILKKIRLLHFRLELRNKILIKDNERNISTVLASLQAALISEKNIFQPQY